MTNIHTIFTNSPFVRNPPCNTLPLSHTLSAFSVSLSHTLSPYSISHWLTLCPHIWSHNSSHPSLQLWLSLCPSTFFPWLCLSLCPPTVSLYCPLSLSLCPLLFHPILSPDLMGEIDRRSRLCQCGKSSQRSPTFRVLLIKPPASPIKEPWLLSWLQVDSLKL